MTAAEFAVMKALWQVETGTVAEIRERHAVLGGTELAYTTVMTLLGRLACKGAVAVDKSAQPFVYRPAVAQQRVRRERLRKFLDTVFDGRADSLVLHLMEDESLSPDDLDRLRKRLAELDPEGEGEA